jgi:hypothetical protein
MVQTVFSRFQELVSEVIEFCVILKCKSRFETAN